jgi:pimeloyl-ACP methyl ester carboxylesterase
MWSHTRALVFTTLLFLAGGPLYPQDRSMEQDPSLDNLVLPEGYETSPLGTFGHVDERGEGPVPMVLVPGGGFGWEVFESFMEANRSEYTMYAVSLAGMGGTQAPPMPPEGTSYGEQTWIRGAVTALVELIEPIEGEGLDRPVVVGHFLEGTQVGLRMAIDHPELVRGVVLLSGSPVLASPERRFTVEERIRYQDEYMAPEWFKTVTRRTWNDNNFPPESYSRDEERGARLFDRVSRGPLPVFIRYLLEFWASDLTTELDDVDVPVLVLKPDFEEKVLEQNPWLAYYFTDSWDGMDRFPKLSLRTVNDAHIFVWHDRPRLVDEAIDEFVHSLGKR